MPRRVRVEFEGAVYHVMARGNERKGQEPAAWTRRDDAVQQRERVREAAAKETDQRICLWARVRLGGERPIDLARECGYADASGVTQTVKRLEQRGQSDQKMAGQLALLRRMSKVND